MKKLFVLDTNVLLDDPDCLDRFGEIDIMIPIKVIEEIDKFKKGMDEIGRNARHSSRRLDASRKLGSLASGVPLETGGTLYVKGIFHKFKVPTGLDPRNPDDQILAIALTASRENREREVILVSRDVNMRIKADAYGIRARDYEDGGNHHRETAAGHQGWIERETTSTEIDAFYAGKTLDCASEELAPHTCVILRTGEGTGTQSALGKVDAQGREIRPLEFYDQHELGIRPLNVQQKFALELLLDDEIKLVTLDGKAGTGKTLLALAAGLASINEDRYNRLLVSRPVIPMGREIGFLPGKLEEKLIPWMQPVFDNLDFLLDLLGRGRKKDQRLTRQKLMQNDILEIEALSFIRGRSLPRQYFIVDEAQNLTRHEVKTIISRAGRDTKIVLTGDQFQIDNPYVDTNSNGMQYVIEKFREVPLAGHITLVQGERSQLAELAADML